MKYYIATKLENWKAHNDLRDKLNALGHQITYDWTTHGPVYEKGLEVISNVAYLEYEGVCQADALIMLWPGGRGTHVELGIALASAVSYTYIVSDVEDHHHATKETCAFYHHPWVELFRSTEELLKYIGGRHYL